MPSYRFVANIGARKGIFPFIAGERKPLLKRDNETAGQQMSSAVGPTLGFALHFGPLSPLFAPKIAFCEISSMAVGALRAPFDARRAGRTLAEMKESS